MLKLKAAAIVPVSRNQSANRPLVSRLCQIIGCLQMGHIFLKGQTKARLNMSTQRRKGETRQPRMEDSVHREQSRHFCFGAIVGGPLMGIEYRVFIVTKAERNATQCQM